MVILTSQISIILLQLLFNYSIYSVEKNLEKVTPDKRWGSMLQYDPVRNQFLLFGGASERQNFLNDTWIYKNGTWKELEIKGPSARGFSAITFHEKRGTVILHGGRGNERVTYSDVWEFDGNRWNLLNESSGYRADHHQMVYLPEEEMILGFGGWTGDGVTGQTWVWDDTWKSLDVESPPGRASFGMAYNSDESKVVLYGGLWINGQYADIWNFKDNRWLQEGGPYSNSSLDHHSLAYHSRSGKIIGFGGKNYRYVMQNITFLVGERVDEITRDGPLARHSFAMAQNFNTGDIFMFGGKIYDGDEQLPLGDLWRWDGVKWIQIH